MNWDKVPQTLRDRYKCFENEDLGDYKFQILEDMNKYCMPIDRNADSRAYEIFASQFNSTMLMAHFFENMLTLEDRRYECAGYPDFQISIPAQYFRHPSLFSDSDFPDAEKVDLLAALCVTKDSLNFSKDQSFVLSQLHKLEFIYIFSYLEAYIENVMVEFLGKDKKYASKRIRDTLFPGIMKEVFNEINLDIVDVICSVEPDTFKFFAFCRRVRNLHMHNLGIVTQRFFDECAKDDLFRYDIYAETAKPVTDYARPNFSFFDYIIKPGKVLNLSVVSRPFRLIAREVVLISEAYCKQKSSSVSKSTIPTD